jgi:hypothetical protein
VGSLNLKRELVLREAHATDSGDLNSMVCANENIMVSLDIIWSDVIFNNPEKKPDIYLLLFLRS